MPPLPEQTARRLPPAPPHAQVQRSGERAKRVTNQEDGAGGHGLGRGESENHKALVEMGKRLEQNRPSISEERFVSLI